MGAMCGSLLGTCVGKGAEVAGDGRLGLPFAPLSTCAAVHALSSRMGSSWSCGPCLNAPSPHVPLCSPLRRTGKKLEMARHDGGAALSRSVSLAESSLRPPGRCSGYPAFLALPSGTVGDPALAPFLHPSQNGIGGRTLRLRGFASAME
jgi:hypothetical protein